MTDKDPKDMTASELLRKADSHPCSMCHLVMAGDESCATTGCASWAYRLADKIDAELAEARADALNVSLRSGAELWAKANGWPDFKDGDDFGAWLDRCFLPRPRFEDGEPVQFEDNIDELHGVEKFIFTLSRGGSCQMQDADGNMLTVFTGGFVKRHAPEALGADGKPIVEGETVWLDEAHSRCAGSCGFEDGNKYSLCGIERQEMLTVEDAHIEVDGREYVRVCTCGAWCHASWLTHTPPDTQERIDDDATMHPAEYCAVRGIDLGDDPDREAETVAMVLDLLRRQRELDKRTGGE